MIIIYIIFEYFNKTEILPTGKTKFVEAPGFASSTSHLFESSPPTS